MNILPTYNELTLRCFMIYISAEKTEKDELHFLIQRSEEGIDRHDHGIVVNLPENITMKVSMNIRGTFFVKFRQLNYKNETIDIAEFFYDKDEKFVIKNFDSAKNSDPNVLTVKQLFLSELNK